MPERHSLRALILGALAALALAVVFLPGLTRSVAALTPSGNELSSSPLIIPAADFSSDGYLPGSALFSFAGGYTAGMGTSKVQGGGCIKAPVYLPRGASINSFAAYVYNREVYDPETKNDLVISLHRIRTITGLHEVLGQVRDLGGSSDIHALINSSIHPNQVDDLHAYYVTTCLWTNKMRLYGVRIYFFAHHVYLPIVQR
jgi:hypothetical protein